MRLRRERINESSHPALHGHLRFGNGPLVDEIFADAAIGVPVGGVVVDVYGRTRFEVYFAGTLDLKEEKIHRVIQPRQGPSRVFQNFPIADGFAVVIGYEAMAVDPSGDFFSFQSF